MYAWYVSLNGLHDGLASAIELQALLKDLGSQPQQQVIAAGKKAVTAHAELSLLQDAELHELIQDKVRASCSFLLHLLDPQLSAVAKSLDALFDVSAVRTSMSFAEMCQTWAEDGSVLNEGHITRGLGIDQQEEAMKIDVWSGAAKILKQWSPKSAPEWLEQSSSLELLHGDFSSFCTACNASQSFSALKAAEDSGNGSAAFEQLGHCVAAVQGFTKEFSTLKQRATAAELAKSLAGLDKNLEAIGDCILVFGVVVFGNCILVSIPLPNLYLGC